MDIASRIVTLVTLRIVMLGCFMLTIPALFVSIMETDSGIRPSTVAMSAVILLTPPLSGCAVLWATNWLERNRKTYVYAAPVVIASWVALAIYLGPDGFRKVGRVLLYWAHGFH
jgi:hypothetical protein